MFLTALAFAGGLAIAWPVPASGTDVLPFVLSEEEVRAAAVTDPTRLARTIRDLSAIPSRAPGYGGDRTAARLIRDAFEEAGLADVRELPFSVTSPVQRYAELTGQGMTATLHACWPNLVRTSTTPPDGITGPLVYAGRGTLGELSGVALEGAIVVLEYNSGRNWLNVPALGGRAVLFIEPEDTDHQESAAKFLRTPVNVPRFWIARPEWQRLLGMIERKPTRAAAGGERTTFQTAESFTVRARVDWEVSTAVNLVGWAPGTDEDFAEEVVVLSAYYDSMSVVPSLAPGAEQACGIAALLDLARYFAAHPAPRPVLFLATSAHGLFMEGAASFFDRQLDELGVTPVTFIALDLASGSRKVGAYNVGHAYWDGLLSSRLKDLFAPLGNHLNAVAHRTSLALGLYTEEEYVSKGLERNPLLTPFVETLTQNSLNKAGVHWGYTVPTGMVHEAETALLFARPGGPTIAYAFVTWGADRPRVDSPLDTFEHVNVDNLAAQVRFLKPMLTEMLHSSDPVNGFIIRIEQIVDWQRQGHRAKVYPPSGSNAGTVSGRVVEFVPKQNYIPDEPKTDAIVVLRREYSNTYLGVRCEPVQRVDSVRDGSEQTTGSRDGPRAYFRFPAVGRAVPGYITKRKREIEAYVFDRDTGDISYARDLGRNGDLTYPTTVYGQTTPQEVSRTVVVFPCYPVDVFDLFEPRYMQILSEIRLLDAQTDSEPEAYGLALAPAESSSGAEPAGNSYYDPCATLFIQRKERRSRVFKALGAAGIFGQRLALLNASEECPTGAGYDAADGPIHDTAFLAARDMTHLNADRINTLFETGVLSTGDRTPDVTGTDIETAEPAGDTLIVDLHRRSVQHLARAEEARERLDYVAFLRESRSAWALASRAYPLVLRTGKDAVLSVLFYLALLIPAAYFLEKLLFGYPDIKRQLLGRAGIFAAVFLLLRFVNPAFQLTVNPYVVLLGFVMIALTLAVLQVILKMFKAELNRLRVRVTGVHNIEIGRSDAAGVAFGLGISSMRKRKVRTANTLITLIILTFSVLSFTSVVSKNALKGRDLYDQSFRRVHAPYDGVLFRTPLYDPISNDTYEYVLAEFGGADGAARRMAPRAWFPGGVAPKQAMTVVGTHDDEKIGVPVVLGVTPEEARVSLTNREWLTGQWFEQGDRDAAILPHSLAEGLGLSTDDVGTRCLEIWGRPFALRGILSDDFFNREKGFRDIDGEPLSPINFAMSGQAYQEVRSRRADIVAKKPPPTFHHYNPGEVLIVPFDTALAMGGNVRSIAIVSEDPVGITEKTLRDEVLNKMATGLFAGIGGRSYWYTSLGQADFKGLFSLSVLILISGLIVFNTILGSLYERQREIGVYTSLGLAPSHIGSFFLAESCVYAVLGALFGYCLGQVAANFKMHLGVDLLHGLALNYSSRSALYATLIVSAVVMLSSLYPAWKASRLSVPDLERTIKLPAPFRDPASGHLAMTLDFPFTFTGEARIGIAAFVFKYFKDQEELATGAFHAQDTTVGSGGVDRVGPVTLEATVWLAPFDWGVSQLVRFEVTEEGGEPVLLLSLLRINGEVKAWQRVNRRFVAELRRQLLLWRTIAPEDRARYIRYGRELLSGRFDAVLEAGRLEAAEEMR